MYIILILDTGVIMTILVISGCCTSRSNIKLQDDITIMRMETMILIYPSNAEATIVQCTRTQKMFEKHLNPVMKVFIGKLRLSVLEDEYLYARISIIFKFLLPLCIGQINQGSIRLMRMETMILKEYDRGLYLFW